jgi:serpin B
MLVVLPKTQFGLADLENTLTAAKIDEWFVAGRMDVVTVKFPRMEEELRLPLASALSKLGMSSAFDCAHADFSGIAAPVDSANRLYLGAVVQKTSLAVDEQGTEAAAAAVVANVPSSAPRPPPIVFEAHHPFLYFLRDDVGNILFMGRVRQ